QHQEVGPGTFDAAGRVGEQVTDLGPTVLVLQSGQLGEVDTAQHEPRRREPAEPVAHPEVEVAVVDRRALPAHPADQADRLHARQSPRPRAVTSPGSHESGSRRHAYSSRCTLCWAAWARGLITSSSMLTWLGRVAIQTIASATSSATSGSATPAYTESARAWSPPKRTSENPSVRTMPGAISLIRIGSPSSSRRSVSVTTWVPCLAAVYPAPPS